MMSDVQQRSVLWLVMSIASAALPASAAAAAPASAPFTIVSPDQPPASVFVDATGASADHAAILHDAAAMLSDGLARATGEALPLTDALEAKRTIIIARADRHPEIAGATGIDREHLDAFCIVSRADRLYILGVTEVAARHGVATLLRDLGFRFYNPSPRWWIAPKGDRFVVDRADADQPALRGRRIWYAYGVKLDALQQGYQRWSVAHRLVEPAPFRTGHSFGNIIGRNRDAFEQHPEYFALDEDGKRQTQGPIAARKFCYSNPGLADLIVRDRIALLKASQTSNPYAFMVSIDPSDGEGTCHCGACQALGTPTDRVIHLANAVARGLREADPRAWVGLYAYSSHRLPPTIDLEPNVYVQVAMGFNRTAYSLDELVGLWAQKASSIGLREYYGVMAWDWGLPGRMRGANADYHARWIPFYAERRVNAINAETNANWGAQTPGLHVAAELMWNPSADADALVSDFLTRCFGEAAEPMGRLYRRFDRGDDRVASSGPPDLNPFVLKPMFDDLAEAMARSSDPQVRARLIDMMAYLNYVVAFERFTTARSRDPKRGDAYYAALEPLMRYAWQTRHRGMVHSYALARRLCNGLPVTDGRLEFWMFLAERRPNQRVLDQHQVAAEDLPSAPVWMDERQLTDDQVRALFEQEHEDLRRRAAMLKRWSSRLKPITIAGETSGHAHVFLDQTPGRMRVRGGMEARLRVAEPGERRLIVEADSRRCELQVIDPGGAVVLRRSVKADEGPVALDVAFAQPGLHVLTVTANFTLTAPTDLPMAVEASPTRPFHAEYSGGHAFYVPADVEKLLLNVDGRLSLIVPGQGRVDLSGADVDPQLGCVAFDVPETARGAVWQTFHQTRGTFYFINIPPWLSVQRQPMLLPAEMVDAIQKEVR